MASPWEQSSSYKHHPPALNGVERGVQERWWWKIHHLSYHPEKPTHREERNQCKTAAAFPLPSCLYLLPFISPAWEGQMIDWSGQCDLAPSTESHPTPPPFPLHIHLSIHVYTRAHTHAHTKRGPCNFHVEQEERGKGKEDGE